MCVWYEIGVCDGAACVCSEQLPAESEKGREILAEYCRRINEAVAEIRQSVLENHTRKKICERRKVWKA